MNEKRFVRFESSCNYHGEPLGVAVIDAENVVGVREDLTEPPYGKKDPRTECVRINCAGEAEYYVLCGLEAVLWRLGITA